jgi:hypothetical protein
VRIGKRTVVAIPVQDRAQLPALAAKAEIAAAHADKYTIGDGPVDRYRVFIADDPAWKRWYDGLPGRWVAGQALPTGRSEVEVEAKLSELTPGYADTLLRHELAHVATLRSDRYYGRDDVWWLVEGMAEYAATEGPYPDHADLRTYLRGHTLRSVVVTPPAASASGTDASGRYAVGYYALRYLMTKYGKAKTLRFFEQAVQFGIGLDTASLGAFGKPWAQVDKDCAAAVRKA